MIVICARFLLSKIASLFFLVDFVEVVSLLSVEYYSLLG